MDKQCSWALRASGKLRRRLQRPGSPGPCQRRDGGWRASPGHPFFVELYNFAGGGWSPGGLRSVLCDVWDCRQPVRMLCDTCGRRSAEAVGCSPFRSMAPITSREVFAKDGPYQGHPCGSGRRGVRRTWRRACDSGGSPMVGLPTRRPCSHRAGRRVGRRWLFGFWGRGWSAYCSLWFPFGGHRERSLRFLFGSQWCRRSRRTSSRWRNAGSRSSICTAGGELRADSSFASRLGRRERRSFSRAREEEAHRHSGSTRLGCGGASHSSGRWHYRGAVAEAVRTVGETKQDGGEIPECQTSRAAPYSAVRDRGRPRGGGARAAARQRSRRREGARRAGGASTHQAGNKDGRERQQEEVRVRGDPGQSRYWWQRRRLGRRNLERANKGCSLQEDQSGLGEASGVDLPERRRFDGGGLPADQECSGVFLPDGVKQSMVGAQEQTASLSVHDQDGVDRQWGARLPEGRAGCRSPRPVRSSIGSARSEQPRLRKLESIPRTSSRTSSPLPCIPGASQPGLARTSHHQDHRRSGARASNVEAQGEGQLSRVSSTPGWCTEEQRRRSPSGRRSCCAKERTKAETQAESKGSRADRRVCAPRGLSEEVESQVPDKPLKVPGAAASTMHAGIWDLAFSALLRARTSLSSFAHSILAGRAPAQRAPKEQVWPMPLPFPEVHCRARSRQKVGASLKLGINYVVLVLNWLHLGEQLCDVAALKLGTKLNLAQWQVVRRISPLVSSWNEQGAVASADMGRSAAKVESIETELRRLEEAACAVKLAEEAYFKRRDEQSSFGFSEAPGEEAGVLRGGGIEHVAKDIDPDRLFFHGVPSFDPEPFLDYNNRMTYRRPLDFAEAIDIDDPKLPKVKLRCPASRRIRVLEKLDSVRRLALLDAARCRRGLENGLFSIPKDQVRDRMVLDARRANAAEQSEKRWIYSLGSLQQFLHVFLAPHEHLEINAEDLREFYHAFVVGAQRQERNILQGSYKPDQVRHLKSFRPELEAAKEIVAALNTLAMGDTNAVAYGQVAHLALLLRTGHFGLEDFITLKNRPSRKKWHVGLMIDDFILVEICERGKRSEEVRRMVEDVRAAYVQYGLPRHEGKAVEHSTKGEFWGAQLDGVQGILRPSLKRLIPLANITIKIVQLGYCTVGLLEVLSGCYVAAFQLRRRLMSALEHIYSAQRSRSRSTIVRLSSSLKNELLEVVGLLPLAVIDMRIKPSSTLVASDASTQAEAAVAFEIGEKRTAEFQKHGIQKGLWNRLLSPSASYLRSQGLLGVEEELRCADEYRMHPIWEEVVSCGQFRPFGKTKKVRCKKHINLGELDAALRAEEKLFNEQPGSFYIHLVDSQVVAACLVKGRSSSGSVNKRLRSSIASHVGQGGRSFIGYVRSKLNPADDPTRGARLRQPSRGFSRWWFEIEEGEFASFDEFLRQRGFLPLQLAELPEAEELYPDAEVDWSSAAERRAERGRRRRGHSGRLVEKGPVAASGFSPQVVDQASSRFEAAEAEITEAVESKEERGKLRRRPSRLKLQRLQEQRLQARLIEQRLQAQRLKLTGRGPSLQRLQEQSRQSRP